MTVASKFSFTIINLPPAPLLPERLDELADDVLRDERRRVEGLVRQGRRLLLVEPFDDCAALVRVAVLGRDRVFEQFERERAAQVVRYVVLRGRALLRRLGPRGRRRFLVSAVLGLCWRPNCARRFL